MKCYKLMVTKSAHADLEDNIDYIAIEIDEPNRVLKLVNKIEEAILSLSQRPERGAYVQDNQLAAQGIRRILVENYIIFYTIPRNEDTVNIIRILYSKRNWVNMI